MTQSTPLRLAGLLAIAGLLLFGCDSTPPPAADAGPPDSGPGMDAGPPEMDAGQCDEFVMTGCPRDYPMHPIPYQNLCEEFADIFCRANARCCTRESERYSSRSECEDAQYSLCTNGPGQVIFEDAILAGDILYSQGNAGGAWVRAGTTAEECEVVDFLEEIRTAMTGTVANGGACVPGSCARAGSACVATGVDTYECQPAPFLDDPCDAEDNCHDRRLTCSGATCQALGVGGEACAIDSECVSRRCTGSVCEDVNAENTYCVRVGSESEPFHY